MSFESFLNNGRLFKPITFLFMAGLLCYSIWLSFVIETKADIRFTTLQLAEELRHSSRDLTRNSRAFIVTGDNRYYEDYKKVLAVREGKMARPDGRTIPLQTLIKNSGVTPEELALLTQAQEISDRLSNIELNTMDQVKDGQLKREEATKNLYGVNYLRTTEEISSPIANLENSIEVRTREEISKAGFLLRTLLILALGSLALVLMANYTFAKKK